MSGLWTAAKVMLIANAHQPFILLLQDSASYSHPANMQPGLLRFLVLPPSRSVSVAVPPAAAQADSTQSRLPPVEARAGSEQGWVAAPD